MKSVSRPIAHKSPLFRIVAFFSRLQFRYLYSNVRNPRLAALGFVFFAGSTAIGTIALAAYIIQLPLLFPPLGPSAFILFHTPLSPAASPRNTILSHSTAVACGLISMCVAGLIFPNARLCMAGGIDWALVISVALATALSSLSMIALQSPHPPAVASALLAAAGYLDDPVKAFGLIVSVIILAAEGFFFNRIVGGLPYPAWKSNPDTVRQYGVLAGIPVAGETFWEQLSRRMFMTRRKR